MVWLRFGYDFKLLLSVIRELEWPNPGFKPQWYVSRTSAVNLNIILICSVEEITMIWDSSWYVKELKNERKSITWKN